MKCAREVRRVGEAAVIGDLVRSVLVSSRLPSEMRTRRMKSLGDCPCLDWNVRSNCRTLTRR